MREQLRQPKLRISTSLLFVNSPCWLSTLIKRVSCFAIRTLHSPERNRTSIQS